MTEGWTTRRPTALLVLADGTVIEGDGLGAVGTALGEVCFNTSLTGYQEILTDPSYARQIVTFTFPHIGNVAPTAKTSRIWFRPMPSARSARSSVPRSRHRRTTAPPVLSTPG